jgi:peptidoglycan/xylan/chitin deacetylase (PgdA/CDA1 family)
MIGVSAKSSDEKIVREFFELFKTEWEFERLGVDYDVIIRSADDYGEKLNAKLVIFYGTDASLTGSLRNVRSVCRDGRVLLFDKDRLPIYGTCLTFPGSSKTDLVDEFTGESVRVLLTQHEHQTVLWIGYDLWEEIRYLLLNGQPELHAEIPALELHIQLLRGLFRQHNVAFAEVPPVPARYKFIACLTHDVDHASIRAHKFDRTIAGFIYRAGVQSFFQFCTGRKSVEDLLRNWFAAISLPLVQLGLLPDIWNRFENYADIEKALPSTFFVVPRAGDPGRLRDGGKAPKLRAVRYRFAKICGQFCRLLHSGHEIALHGINAWLTAKDGTEERAELQKAIKEASSTAIVGVRMHWLYYDQSSPKALDQAGFHYDSTVGYNRTIGYRSGTCQVYKPLGTERLKELPLHVMDTALLFPGYMNCRPEEAKLRIRGLIANASRFGGVLTINWHDRSIAPERLWHRLYTDILAELKDNDAWFATASEAVAWFDKRRAFTFESGSVASPKSVNALPGLTIKEHRPAQRPEPAELSYC